MCIGAMTKRHSVGPRWTIDHSFTARSFKLFAFLCSRNLVIVLHFGTGDIHMYKQANQQNGFNVHDNLTTYRPVEAGQLLSTRSENEGRRVVPSFTWDASLLMHSCSTLRAVSLEFSKSLFFRRSLSVLWSESAFSTVSMCSSMLQPR